MSIDFAKKKTVKVKSFRRKDGTIVKASTRKVKKRERSLGQKIGDIGRGLIPVAKAAATGARALSILSDAQDRRRLVGRELSGVGEARKFLSVAGPAGSGFRSASLGIDTLSNLGSGRSRISLAKQKLNLKKSKLKQDELRTEIWAESVRQAGRKNDIAQESLRSRYANKRK